MALLVGVAALIGGGWLAFTHPVLLWMVCGILSFTVFKWHWNFWPSTGRKMMTWVTFVLLVVALFQLLIMAGAHLI